MTIRLNHLLWSLAAFLVGGATFAVSFHRGLYREPAHVGGIILACVIIIWGILRCRAGIRSR